MRHRHMRIRLVKSEVLRHLLVGAGWLSLIAGVVGLFLPLIPSIPFLLFSVICFSRSSERFHSWLVEHKHLGPMLKDYLRHGAIPLRAKILAIGMIWISFPVTSFLFVEKVWLRIVLLSIAACVTLYLLVLPNASSRANRTGTRPPER